MGIIVSMCIMHIQDIWNGWGVWDSRK